MKLPRYFTRSCCVPFDLTVSVGFLLLSGPWARLSVEVTKRFVGRCGNERGETVPTGVFSKEGMGSANWLSKYTV